MCVKEQSIAFLGWQWFGVRSTVGSPAAEETDLFLIVTYRASRAWLEIRGKEKGHQKIAEIEV